MTKESTKNVTQQIDMRPAKWGRKVNTRLKKTAKVRALVRAIVAGAKKPDSATQALGLKMRRLKTIVENEILSDGTTWHEWAKAEFDKKLDVSFVRLLNDLAIASDDEARAVLLAHRTDGAKRARKWRAKNQAETRKAARMAMERKWMIRWATSAPYSEVTKAWKYLRKTYDA